MAPHADALFSTMSIGERLRYAMEVRGMKQTELAEKIGIGQAAISNIVTNRSRKPSAPTLIALATELRVNPNWILEGVGDPYRWAPVTEERQVELLNMYRQLDDRARSDLLDHAQSMVSKLGLVREGSQPE